MKKKILLLVAAAFMLNSCEDLFEPAKENFKDEQQMHDDPAYAQGFLLRAYGNIPDTTTIVNMLQMMLLLIKKAILISQWLQGDGLPVCGHPSTNGVDRLVPFSISIFSWRMWTK